jgi:hypothetical protein
LGQSRRNRWLALKPWEPFFWGNRLPIGIYLRSVRKPALLPSGHEVDEDIFFAIRMEPEVEKSVLVLHRYAFRKNPGRHTKRSVRREGYWHFDIKVSRSPEESVLLLKDMMREIERLAASRETTENSLGTILNQLVAWEERMALKVSPSY